LKKKSDLTDEIVDYVMEMNLWEYDEFDDYIEVIFQYFYIVVFAAIFPLAAPLSLIFNIIETKSDNYKITYNFSLNIKIKTILAEHAIKGDRNWVLENAFECGIYHFNIQQHRFFSIPIFRNV
jgi:hypothetical protein